MTTELVDLDLLADLGDALERAAGRDLHRRRSFRRRRIALGVAVAVLVPSGAVAATQLLSTDDVARSLPAGTLSLAGTAPACTVVKEGVEYRCTLKRPPAPEVSDWKGTVEPTVDASKHVNGGCRSLTSDGQTWECYLGQTAVDQKIIGAGLLGQPSAGPGVG
ncbi:MAG: hypothetical protein QOG68_66 [Solirubrobacteraceae bacterium]|jgi:hypothetical protein|nr:hypothetical protein [Solirubrobacteraceae bacterium]